MTPKDMKRALWFARLGCVAGLLFLPAAAHAASAPPRSPPPNIVFILADDLWYGDVPCYNAQSKIPTPNLDRLAAEGIRFTGAHAPDAVCTPTLYGPLTGRCALRSRLKSGVLPPWGEPLIEEDRLTYAQVQTTDGGQYRTQTQWIRLVNPQ
jgi:arylsulfatase A